MQFALMFFAASEDAFSGDKYKLVIDSARYADQHGFSGIWVPERHFTPFGGLYPNPAVLHAALARETKQVRLRAGSVVMPLHHPLRVAEEWSVVDNLSNGRIDISFASGWNPNDFAFFPDRYEQRHAHMLSGIETVKQLWQGNEIDITNGKGETSTVRIYPTPLQKMFPIWVTAAGNPRTYADAGRNGAHVLTHLLDQTTEELAEKIALYRANRAEAGFDPKTGQVSVMLHTFVGADGDQVRELAREPYCNYMKNNIGILRGLARSRGQDFNIETMSDADLDAFLNFLYERFAATRGLIGTPENCLPLINQLHEIGVTEIACLLDFGPQTDDILASLPHLNQLKSMADSQLATRTPSIRPITIPTYKNGNHKNGNHQKTLASAKKECRESLCIDDFYTQLSQRGVQLDGVFRGLSQLWQGEKSALGALTLSADLLDNEYELHPAILDGCLQVLAAALPNSAEITPTNSLYLPSGFEQLSVFGRFTSTIYSHATLTSTTASQIKGNVSIYAEDGTQLVDVRGIRLQKIELPTPPAGAKRDWLFETQWQPIGAAPSPHPVEGHWLILADDGGLADVLAERLHVAGCEITRIRQNSADFGDLTSVTGVINLWPFDGCSNSDLSLETLIAEQQKGVIGSLNLLKSLDNAGVAAPVYFVTQQAQAVADGPIQISQTPLWGLARSVPMDLPHLWGGLIDLDAQTPIDASATEIFTTIFASDDEDQVAFRAGTRYGARLTPIKNNPSKPLEIDRSASYLITGGLGSFGMQFAAWLADQQAARVVLVNRSQPSTEKMRKLDALREKGCEIVVLQADVVNKNDMAQVLLLAHSETFPLKGIVHAAGVSAETNLTDITPTQLESILAPKLSGTWILHELTADIDLDFFISPSSLSSVWGTKGLAHYAAANHFLDAFCTFGQQQNRPTYTFNIGPMSGGGMVAQAAQKADSPSIAELGLRLLAPQDVIPALFELMPTASPQTILVEADWATFSDLYNLRGQRPFLQHVEVHGSESAETATLFNRLKEMADDERTDEAVAHLQATAATILKHNNPSAIDPDRGFFDMGMDSLMALDMKTRLQRDCGVPLPATLLFEQPTIQLLAVYLVTHLFGEIEEAQDEQTPIMSTMETDITALSEAELAQLIDAELEGLMDG